MHTLRQYLMTVPFYEIKKFLQHIQFILNIGIELIFSTGFNLLTVLVGADFKWYDKVFELDDSDWIELRSSNHTSFAVKSEILSTVYLSFSVRCVSYQMLKFDY